MRAAHKNHAGGVRLTAALPHARVAGDPAVRVTGCTTCCQNVRTGDAYVVLERDPAERARGISTALSRGAVAIIAESTTNTLSDLRSGATQALVPSARHAYGALCHALVGDPSHTLPTICVGGGPGKTSVSRLVAGVLGAAGGSPAYSGDHQPAIGSPAGLARWLAEVSVLGASHAIVEAPYGQALRGGLTGLRPDTLCFTAGGEQGGPNSEKEHSHGGQLQGPAELLKLLPDESILVYASTDSLLGELAEGRSGPSIQYALTPSERTGNGAGAAITAELLERSHCEQIVLLRYGADSAAFRTPTIGDFHLSNCLAAAAVGLAYGAPLTAIARGLESVQLATVLRPVRCGQDFNVYLDSAADLESLHASLAAVRSIAQGRLLCVAPGGSDPAGMARLAQQMADQVIVTAKSPAGSPSRSVRWLNDRFTALTLALAVAEPGDAVLLAGHNSSHDYDGVSELETVRALLTRRQAEMARAQRAA